MQKKFITNLALLLFLNLLVKPFWILGIDRGVQNVTGPAEYGFYFALFNFSFLFNILLDLGITSFNNRNIAQNQHLLNKHFSGILGLRLVLAVFYLLVTLCVGLVVGYDTRQLSMLLLLGLNQFLLSGVLYLRSNISGLLMFRTDSFLSVFDRVLMILFCSFLLWGDVIPGPFRIEWFVYAQTAAYILTAVVAFAVVVRKSGFRKIFWNRAFSAMIIRKSFPFAVLILLMTFYNRVDSVMIERLLEGAEGDMQAGIYASAYRLLDAANMIAYLFAVLLLPLFSRMIKNGENTANLVKLSFSLLFTITVPLSAASFFYAYELMDLLYLEHVAESAAVFRVLMPGLIAISTTYIFGTLLTANNNLRALNIVAAGGMILNIVLNTILIPVFKAEGSAYSSLVTQFITALLQFIIAIRIFRFQFSIRFMLALVVFFLGTIVLHFIISGLIASWMAGLTLSVICSVGLASVLRLLPVRKLAAIIRERPGLTT